MNRVYIKRHSGYGDTERLKSIFEEGLKLIGKDSISGKKVLVKPNFLKPSNPEKAIITNPRFLTALIGLLKDSGAEVSIGDSPGLGKLQDVLAVAGLADFIRHSGVKVADFSKIKWVKHPKPLVFNGFELPEIIFDVDEVINVPKLKTHQMMLLTLAVKNLFGCISGFKKGGFHLTAGENHALFASMLLDLYTLIKPGINILDGITGMEGDGPSSGDLRDFEMIAISDDALSLDVAVSMTLGVKPERVPYLKIARENNFSGAEESQIEVYGDSFRDIKDNPVKLPYSHASDFGLPGFFKKFAKRFLISYPQAQLGCKSCGICVIHCPVSAIEIRGNAIIDRTRCIRCYCCQELCEHRAIRVKKNIW